LRKAAQAASLSIGLARAARAGSGALHFFVKGAGEICRSIPKLLETLGFDAGTPPWTED
jgi:hypothetical protein